MSTPVEATSGTLTREQFSLPRLDLFWRFICERQMVWRRRSLEKLPPPWTDDHILREQRFTNIYRELDPGTQYVINNVLEIEAPKPDKIFNTMLYRLVGRAETHAAVGFQYLATFDPQHFITTLKRLRDVEGKAPFTAAYMVSAYASMGSHDKVENVARLFDLLHRRFDAFYASIEGCHHPSEVYETLSTAQGFGNFLAYQTLVDLLYPLNVYGGKPLLPYTHDDWASAGPGARRGIAMLLAAGVTPDHLAVMRWLRGHQDAEFERLGLAFPFLADADGRPKPISLANIQNCLCEFHKYVKISEGTGRGRRKFASAQTALSTVAAPAGTRKRRKSAVSAESSSVSVIQPTLFGG
ncbi:MAG TPA: nucleotide kinase domain-containing protein [Ktedonobacterales bacterium]|nr:nucleotide kinase domain-containing protein [Ktedonobacterales bacterium]